MATKERKNINYKKLFIEAIASFCVMLGICLICVGQSITAYGATVNREYEQLREIVEDVKFYNYNNGRDYELEKTLDSKFSNAKNRKAETFYYGLARAIYYCNIGYFNTANDTFEQIENISTDDERDMADRDTQKVLCERKQSNE